MKDKISLVIDKGSWKEFQDYCNANGFSYSKKVEVMIRQELDGKTRKEKKHQEIMDILAELVEEKAGSKRHEERKTEAKTDRKSVTDLKSLTDRYWEKKKQRAQDR